MLTRKGGSRDALQLEGRLTSRYSFWALITMPIMHQSRSLNFNTIFSSRKFTTVQKSEIKPNFALF